METRRQRVFVGDVQGCREELQTLLERLRFNPKRQELWFTGDLVNRGPDSLGVLRLAVELDANTVLGNHDLHLLRAAAGDRAPGVRDTFQDILAAADREMLLDWLRRRPLVHMWDDLLLVHAGVSPGWEDPAVVSRPLERSIRAGHIPWNDEDLRFLVQVRLCDSAGRRPANEEDPPAGFHPWDRFYRGHRTVVFGHWAARGTVRGERVRGLDSGCVWGGALTAWVAEEDRFVSVPARDVYQVPRGD